jgi:dihydroneopterin aldolase/2-amino-4-hydroxy-6-hydroxymethyldihydropteridine diphosphokinase/dihydropteroate synthase
VETSSYYTIEALIDGLAQDLLTTHVDLLPRPDVLLSVTLRKPAALPFAVPGVTITRSRQHYPSASSFSSRNALASSSASPGEVMAFIALGSNISDRIGHIRRAVDELRATEGIRLTRTSRLYESEPMYVEDQDRFINGVIQVRDPSPLPLQS